RSIQPLDPQPGVRIVEHEDGRGVVRREQASIRLRCSTASAPDRLLSYSCPVDCTCRANSASASQTGNPTWYSRLPPHRVRRLTSAIPALKLVTLGVAEPLAARP